MAKGYIMSGSTVGGLSKRTRQILFMCVALTLAVFFIPFGRIIGYPLVLLSTLAHEMGHGITALLVGGHFTAFHMWADGSGVAHVGGNFSRLASAAVAAGGLLGPSVAAALSFAAARKPSIARIFLSLLGVALIVSEFFFVRNLFGWVFVGCLAAIFL